MTPEYLYKLADVADPDKLWRLSVFRQLELKDHEKEQLDIGIAIRRYASYIGELEHALKQKKSLCITPISSNGVAIMLIETPERHKHDND